LGLSCRLEERPIQLETERLIQGVAAKLKAGERDPATITDLTLASRVGDGR